MLIGPAAVDDFTDLRTVVSSTAVIMVGGSTARGTETAAASSAFPKITISPGGEPTGEFGTGMAVFSWVV